jgi:sugar lactone lactonase YvrE
MSAASWELVADGFARLEAPCFDKEGRLCFADRIPPGTLQRIERDGSVTTLYEREDVGGLVPHADGGLLVSGRDVAILGDDGRERIVMTPEGGWGFNDVATDAAGNVFVGMHGERPTAQLPTITASLWRLGVDGTKTFCYDGVTLTNGIRVSPDGTHLYHNDTHVATVWVSDLDDAGLPVRRRAHHVLRFGNPDGMAIDEAGCPWVAACGAGKVVRITPDGKEDLVVDTPQDYVASLCFGGGDRRDLYIVTFGGEPYDPGHSGAIYRTRVDVVGAPVVPARI